MENNGKQRPDELSMSDGLEEHYADIGRSVVANATAQVQNLLSRLENPGPDDSSHVVVAVPIWITAPPPDPQSRRRVGDVCCVCTVEMDGVLVCRGTCC